MKIETMRRAIGSLALYSFAVFLFGCSAAGFQTGGYVAQGRQAMFAGNYQIALGYFQSAEETEPSYVFSNELREGVLSYLGRAQYLTGQYEKARQTLERSLSQHQGNSLTRLYLGMTLARLGNREEGLKQIEGGLNGIIHFLNYITEAFRFSFGQYWDPNQNIRNACRKTLATIAAGNIDWPMLIASGESIAMKMEQEPDQAKLAQERAIFQGQFGP